MDKRIDEDIKLALSCLQRGDLAEAQRVLSSGYVYNYESKEVEVTQLYCNYWIDKLNNLLTISDYSQRGEQLFIEWKKFLRYTAQQVMRFDDAIYSIKVGVFSMALVLFNMLKDTDGREAADTLTKKGICYKQTGRYENACECLVNANALTPQNAYIVALLADCHALCGNDKYAKVLFREAFYLGCFDIDIDFLDSELIRDLIKKVRAKGFSGQLLNAWIGVYAVVWGVFNIKRKLSSKEISKLRQEIYALENEQKDPGRATKEGVPKLINLYFRLIDHCKDLQDMQKISETLLKIKILDMSVYEEYMR